MESRRSLYNQQQTHILSRLKYMTRLLVIDRLICFHSFKDCVYKISVRKIIPEMIFSCVPVTQTQHQSSAIEGSSTDVTPNNKSSVSHDAVSLSLFSVCGLTLTASTEQQFQSTRVFSSSDQAAPSSCRPAGGRHPRPRMGLSPG